MPTTPRSYSHESRREAASRNLSEVLGPAPEYELPEIRAEHLDLSGGDSVNVSNPLGGWGEKPANRRHMRVVATKHRPMVSGFGVRLLDYKRLNGSRFSFNFEDAGGLGAGMSRILPSSGFAFTRPARAWADDPRGAAVRCFEADLPRAQYITASQAGLLTERAGKQLMLRTTFGAGTLPARTGAGTTTDDSVSMFNPAPNGIAASFKRVILTAGNPHGSDGVQTWPPTRTSGAGNLTLSLYHHDDAGATLYWRLQRTSDSKYWNEGSRTWQVGSVNNAMPSVMTSAGMQVAARGITGSATTYTFAAVQPSGGTVSRVNRVHHVQLEEKAFESSPMPFQVSYTEGTPGYRDNDLLQLCNDSGARVFVRDRGTFLTRFWPRWATADLDGLKAYLLAVEYDANNSIVLYYDGATSTKNRFVLEVKAGGSTTTLAAVSTITRNTETRVGMRWASQTYNELFDDYGTPTGSNAWFDVWVGSTVLFSGQAALPTETNESRVQVACRDGENLDAIVGDWAVFKSVLTSQEMAAAL